MKPELKIYFLDGNIRLRISRSGVSFKVGADPYNVFRGGMIKLQRDAIKVPSRRLSKTQEPIKEPTTLPEAKTLEKTDSGVVLLNPISSDSLHLSGSISAQRTREQELGGLEDPMDDPLDSRAEKAIAILRGRPDEQIVFDRSSFPTIDNF